MLYLQEAAYSPESKSLAYKEQVSPLILKYNQIHSYHQGIQLGKRVLDIKHLFIQRQNRALDV